MTQTELRPADTTDAPDAGCAFEGGCGSRGRSVTRRAAIGAGVVTGAALLAACGSSDTATTSTSSTSSTAGTTPASSSSSTSSSTSASTSESEASESEASESQSSTSGSSSAAPSGTEIAKVADVPSGGSLVVASGDQQIALARNADGSVVAHSAICTHQGCTVKADGATLSCPCHGSTFDAFTGAATKAPATTALAAVTVSVSGDAVYLSA